MEPIENVRALMDTAMAVQAQLNEAMEILRKRDRQIDVALKALEDISVDKPGTIEIASKAIMEMHKIHKESLTPVV